MNDDIETLHNELLKRSNRKSTPKRKRANDTDEDGIRCIDYNPDNEFERTVKITREGVLSGESC